MCLSNAILFGMSLGFGMALAQIYVLFRNNDAHAYKPLARTTIGRVIVYSSLATLPLAAVLALVNSWLPDDIPRHCLSTSVFIAITWMVTSSVTYPSLLAPQINSRRGFDVLVRSRLRVAVLGSALGVALFFAAIFGGHFWWREEIGRAHV